MSKRKDLSGIKFGRLTVLSESLNRKFKSSRNWICKCDCGKEAIVTTARLNSGKTKSCGCLNVESNTDHGHASGGKISSEYKSWAGMKYRCYDPKYYQFKNYGGRGIKVCDRWLNSFENFLEDMGPKPSQLHTLDRYPNKNGDYELVNCRWATQEQQQNNRTNNCIVEYMGQEMTLIQAARKIGMWEQNLRRELKKGRTIPELIGRRNRKNPINYSFGFIGI
jgi:hypothetical protein